MKGLEEGAFRVVMEAEEGTEIDGGVGKNWLLDNMFKSRLATSDFRLVCGGEAIPCHRLVLAAASDTFRGMLEEHTREAREGRVKVLCSAEAGRALVDFLYTDKLGWRLAGTVF